MASIAGLGFSNPYTQVPTIDDKLGWTRSYPINHLSMDLIHFTDTWFGLKTAPSSLFSNEVKYQLFFAAHAHRDSYGVVNLGENSGGCFYIQSLKTQDLVQLYRILHAYHQYEKSTKGEHAAIFGHHVQLIDMYLTQICTSSHIHGEDVLRAFLDQDKHNLVMGIRTRLDTLVKKLAAPAPVSSFGIISDSDIPLISDEKFARHIDWQNREIPCSVAEQKMKLNLLKAVIEHTHDNHQAPYIGSEELDEIDQRPLSDQLLQIEFSEFEDIGVRPAMEDTRFIFNITDITFAGVFDGHGGSAVSSLAKTRFPSIFMERLQETFNTEGQCNYHKAFEKSIIQLENEIIANGLGQAEGSTATICFIHKRNHVVYTANLGDSEARIYTTMHENNIIIPLSCVRDWSSGFDATRVSKLENNPRLVEYNMTSPNTKYLRYKGINVSRALGDLLAKDQATPGIIHKPKITMQRIPDPAVYGPSKLIIACDGLWDFAGGSYSFHNRFIKVPSREEDFANRVMAHNDSSTLARGIGRLALDEWHSKDNVTVLALTIK